MFSQEHHGYMYHTLNVTVVCCIMFLMHMAGMEISYCTQIPQGTFETRLVSPLSASILQYTGVATVWYMMFSIHLPGSQLWHTCTNSDQKFFEPLLASPLCFLFCKYAQDKSLYGMYL